MSYTAHDASRSEFHRDPVPLVSESGLANTDGRANGAIRLYLFERGYEAVGAGIVVQAERSRRVDYYVLVRQDKDGWCCEFRALSANVFFRCGSKLQPSDSL